MEDNKKEKLGIAIIDGKIVDLDNTSSEKLEEYVKKLKEKEAELEAEIDAILER